MYVYEPQLAGFQNWPDKGWPVGHLGEPAPKKQVQDQIQYIEADVTRATQNKRVEISFQVRGAMANDKKAKFIKRFIDPMLQHKVAVNLLLTVNKGKFPVSIAWGNGKFGFNGTIALDRAEAVGGKGSGAVIFIDQEASDLKHLPTIRERPDVGLFHELVHALHTQQGTVVDNEREMERRVIGIGDYTNTKGTENDYRDARGLQLRCCWDRETL